MADFRRADTPFGPAGDRYGRTETLLVEGLDQYFQANYEEAIHLWTRVLFLDRTHARARAYIARARTAIGEQQRRADEMLHAAGDLLDRGDLDAARRLLSEAEQRSGSDEKVAELWARLERVARTRQGVGAPQTAAIVDVVPVTTWRWNARSAARAVALVAVGALVVTAAVSPAVRDLIAGHPVASRRPMAATDAPLPVLTAGEVALVRARTLYARGRLAEALVVLDGAELTDRDAVDALRAEIQRWLLMPRAAGSRAGADVEGAP